ncbi:hypothetical protein R6Q57_024908 [Mikania cordata]
MGHYKTVLFCFFLAGILIFRPTAGRPIHRTIRTEVESPSSAPAESPLGSEPDESDEQTVHAEKHHHSPGVAGGGVIIGGLATVTFAAVYCYIRVTRKRGDQH